MMSEGGQEIHLERTAHRGWSAISIWAGEAVLPGMQSAFIEIGTSGRRSLRMADVIEQRQPPSGTHRIEQLLFEGQTVLVQVIGIRSAPRSRLSPKSALPGAIWHLPQEDHYRHFPTYRRRGRTRAVAGPA